MNRLQPDSENPILSEPTCFVSRASLRTNHGGEFPVTSLELKRQENSRAWYDGAPSQNLSQNRYNPSGPTDSFSHGGSLRPSNRPSTWRKIAEFACGSAFAGAALFGIKKGTEAILKKAFEATLPPPDLTALNRVLEIGSELAISTRESALDLTAPGQAYWQAAGEVSYLGIDSRILFFSLTAFTGFSLAILEWLCRK